MPREFALTEMVNRFESIKTKYVGFCPYNVKGSCDFIAIVVIEGCPVPWELDWEWVYDNNTKQHHESYYNSVNNLCRFYHDQGFDNFEIKVFKRT